METQLRNIDSTNTLTCVDSSFTVVPVRLDDIKRALEQQIKEDEAQLRKNLKEQNELRPKVMRFNDLKRDEAVRNTRMRRIMAVLGTERFKTLNGSSSKDVSNIIGTITADDLPLWELMWAIVAQQPGIQVIELQWALNHFGRKASRQSIESALTTHADEFETKVRGREKFVSLKGA